MKFAFQTRNQPSMNADLTSATTTNRKTDAPLRLGIIKKIKSLPMDVSIFFKTSATEENANLDSLPRPSNRVSSLSKAYISMKPNT